MATTLLDLLAKLRLDSSDYEDGIGEAEGKANKFGKVMSTVGKIGAAAFTAVAAATVAVGKQSLEAYADFEQLSGGIKTLYEDAQGGTQAVERMMENASNAWKTAGMSANDYMEMAIESSASLINSLGGDVDKAAALMDQAIIDMSDNVNKMGTSMEAVQNAYRGFSRGNFTMLDNLALGFAGTKDGMEQLLQKAEEYAAKNGEVRDFTIDSYSDIIEAIHLVQDEMQITGTTADEAAKTISGSINAMKAAWQNLLVGIADEGADIDALVGNLVESFTNVGNNIIPRIQSIMNGVTKVIVVAAEKLVPMAVQVIIDNIPLVAQGALKLIETLVSTIIENTPKLIDAALEIIMTLLDGIMEGIPKLIPAIVDIIITIAEKLTDPQLLINIVKAALDIVVALADGLLEAIPRLIDAIPVIIENLITAIVGAIPQIALAGYKLLTSLIERGPEIIRSILEFLPDLLTSIVTGLLEGIPMIIDVGIQLLTSLVEDLPTIIENIITAIPMIITSLVEAILGNLDKIVEAGFKLLVALGEGLIKAIPQIVMIIPKVLEGIASGIIESAYIVFESGTKIYESISNGFLSKAAGAKELGKGFLDTFIEGTQAGWDALKSLVQEYSDATKNMFQITDDFLKKSSNAIGMWFSEKLRDVSDFVGNVESKIGSFITNIKEGVRSFLDFLREMTVGKLENFVDAIVLKINQLKDKLIEFGNEAKAWGRDAVLNFTDGMREKAPHLMAVMDWLAGGMADMLGHSHPKKGPLADDYKWMPDMMELFAKGIKDNEHLVTDQISESFDFGFNPNRNASPALAAGPTTNTFNITVNGIEELDEVLRWYQGRRVEGRMA